jgi:hypothetical protein
MQTAVLLSFLAIVLHVQATPITQLGASYTGFTSSNETKQYTIDIASVLSTVKDGQMLTFSVTSYNGDSLNWWITIQ